LVGTLDREHLQIERRLMMSFELKDTNYYDWSPSEEVKAARKKRALNPEDLIGKKFGSWTIISVNPKKSASYIAKCDCGRIGGVGYYTLSSPTVSKECSVCRRSTLKKKKYGVCFPRTYAPNEPFIKRKESAGGKSNKHL
jgi:hypothetical protein